MRSDGLDLEKARLALGQLVENARSGDNPPKHIMQLQAYDLATKIFLSGKTAGRPSMDVLEQVIATASERVRGFPDESRGIAEAVMALLEDPKQERRTFRPLNTHEARTLYHDSDQREQADS